MTVSFLNTVCHLILRVIRYVHTHYKGNIIVVYALTLTRLTTGISRRESDRMDKRSLIPIEKRIEDYTMPIPETGCWIWMGGDKGEKNP
jgi:hypothetical protein